jgi:hypothetical protein
VRQLSVGSDKDRATGDVKDYAADHVDQSGQEQSGIGDVACHRVLIDLGARRRLQRVTLGIVRPVFTTFFVDRLSPAPGQLHDRVAS